jgi:hypothetical protein
MASDSCPKEKKRKANPGYLSIHPSNLSWVARSDQEIGLKKGSAGIIVIDEAELSDW